MGATSTLKYRGIEIGYIKTNGFKQEPIYDPSHTDLLYQRITLSVTGVINLCGQTKGKLPIPSQSLNGGSPITGCEATKEVVAIRQSMLTPRGELIYTVDGVELVHAVLGGKGRDEANGPKPIRFDIVKIDGGKTLFVEFEIETFTNECSIGNCVAPVLSKQYSSPILSNRFSITDNLDSGYLHTRTITGTLILSGVFGPPIGQAAADVVARTILPEPPKGWKRDSISMTQEMDTLTYHYSIVDKELHYAMPGQAVSIDAQYTQTFGILGAGIVENEMSVTIQGSPQSDYKDLLKTATRIIYSRIHPQDIDATPDEEFGKEWIVGGMITEDIFNRKFTIKVKTNRDPAKKTTKDGLNVLTHRLGRPLQVDDIKKDKARQPWNYNAYMLACALGNPCDAKVQYPGPRPKEVKPQKEQPVVKIYPPDMEKDYVHQTNYSLEQSDGSYTKDNRNAYSVETDYHTYQMSVAIPGAPAQFVTVAAPTSIKKVRWVAHRNNKMPQLPHPETNDILIKTWIFPESPVLHEDGKTWIYGISGEYWYGQYNAYEYGTIELPRNPMYKGIFGKDQNQVIASQFRRDILQKYA